MTIQTATRSQQWQVLRRYPTFWVGLAITLAWVVLLSLVAVIFILLRMDYYHYFLRIRRTLQSGNTEKSKDSNPPPPGPTPESS